MRLAWAYSQRNHERSTNRVVVEHPKSPQHRQKYLLLRDSERTIALNSVTGLCALRNRLKIEVDKSVPILLTKKLKGVKTYSFFDTF
jgi:hypothetical protein